MAQIDEGPDHYSLHAYVGPGIVTRLTPEGRTTFSRIYRMRPDKHRYAVAGEYDLSLHAETYLVWDLFDTRTAGPHFYMDGGIAPEPRLRHDDLDAAIAATVLLYEHD